MKEFFILFFVQLVTYATATVSIRAVAVYNYPLVIITDIVLASFGFFVVRRIAQQEAKSYAGFVGYVSGGLVGSVLSLAAAQYFGV
jgi:outer membrane lipoprotein SlyB